MGQIPEMQSRLAPAKAEAVDARGTGPTIAHGMIGVARLAGFQSAFTLLHNLACGGRRSDLLCPFDHQIEPLDHEAFRCGPDTVGRMLHSVPEIVERPAAHDRKI